ncbi:hypothetical protein CRUP_030929 [Coryphaenoides rupestris]|nr:hypothetical protein CRUP_030929 [Coryphaenoides rupestris]
MAGMSTKGVLGQLGALEAGARQRMQRPPQQSPLADIRATVEALVLQRDQLKAEIEANESVQELRNKHSDRSTLEEEEEEGQGEEQQQQEEAEGGGSEKRELLRLMARHAQLKDLLRAHHLIGGYDIIKTRQGKGVCVSIATSYEGVYLERYTLELDVAPRLRIVRHDVPPFEQHKSVEVMESNALCSILVLMLTTPQKKGVAVLCRLDYSDHTRHLPEEVTVQSEDAELVATQQWKDNCALLRETPLHRALATLIQHGHIK